ncbi:MAG: family 16 glycosylhydrolase [Polyangiaceae bacterium]|nr:family 16 glycosylhydrolase [Polyangiaceae bacterium]
MSYQYGRFEASVRFPAGSGVIGAFFLWKDGSEVEGTFWNELDIEKVGADCALDTNAFYGNPERVHTMSIPVTADLCAGFHTYAYEWTPEYIAWSLDGVEIRRETGETAAAYAENATEGMQIRFNLWPGNASFGGVFDPSILPVYQQIDWVEYSSYANGSFEPLWREDFDASTAPTGWTEGTWDSPKGLSTRSPANVSFADGFAILALTDDAAAGIGGAGTGTGGADPTSVGGSTATGTDVSTATGGSATAAPLSQGNDGGGCALHGGAARPRHAAGLGALLGAILLGRARRRRTATGRGRQS